MAACGNIQLPSQPFDVAFHPQEPLICAGLISGSVELTRISEVLEPDGQDAAAAKTQAHSRRSAAPTTNADRCWRKKGHKQSCRAVAFVDSGRGLLSGSSDKSLILRDVNTGKRIWTNSEAHNAAVNRLSCLGETTVASGDDNGSIKVWDVRQPVCCAAMSVHDDFIADMHHAPEKDKLLAVSGDGTLSVFDLKRYKKEARSEYAEDELLSVTVVKNGRKVVCGSQEGVLLLYSWGHFNDCSDRFPGISQSIDALIKLNEDTVLTGSQEGLIRMVSILPNAVQSIVGQHMDCPIERLTLSGDGCLLASASHDHTIKVWDVSPSSLANEQGEEEEEDVSASDEEGSDSVKLQRAAVEESESSEDERKRKRKGTPKARKTKQPRQQGRSGKGKASIRASFFADL